MSKADIKLLEALHEALAQHFLAEIQAGEAPPSLLNAARQFLKDNGVEAAQGHDVIQSLVEELPEFDNEEVA